MTNLDQIIFHKIKIPYCQHIEDYDGNGPPPNLIHAPTCFYAPTCFSIFGSCPKIVATDKFLTLSKSERLSSDHVKSGIWWWAQGFMLHTKHELQYRKIGNKDGAAIYQLMSNKMNGDNDDN